MTSDRKYRGFGMVAVLVSLTLAGCSSPLVISDVNYAQPIETVLEPDQKGQVEDLRNGLAFNILPLQFAETSDSSAVSVERVRMIRGHEGLYFITANGFSNVYVMAPQKGKLVLRKKITIDQDGIARPAFNQRDNYVQLLNMENDRSYLLNAQGLREQELQEKSEQGG